jgi:putative FmdB family regulatory protein
MPTYEYRCANGHLFERIQRMADPPIDTCPECGAPAERLLSGAGLLFKGSGFYITDYRSDSYKKAAKAESGGDVAKSGGDAAKPAGGADASPSTGGGEKPKPSPGGGGDAGKASGSSERGGKKSGGESGSS